MDSCRPTVYVVLCCNCKCYSVIFATSYSYDSCPSSVFLVFVGLFLYLFVFCCDYTFLICPAIWRNKIIIEIVLIFQLTHPVLQIKFKTRVWADA